MAKFLRPSTLARLCIFQISALVLILSLWNISTGINLLLVLYYVFALFFFNMLILIGNAVRDFFNQPDKQPPTNQEIDKSSMELAVLSMVGVIIGSVLFQITSLWSHNSVRLLSLLVLGSVGTLAGFGQVRELIPQRSERFRSSLQSERIQVLILSATVFALFFVISPVYAEDDSVSYINYARIIGGQDPPDPSLFYRTPGYPFLLFVSGITFLKSLVGMQIVQGAMAVLMPLMVYEIAYTIYRRAAIFAAFGCIATLVPFNFAKTVLTETPYMFSMLLTTYFASRFITLHRTRDLYLTGLACVALITIRPSAQLIFVLFVFIFLWSDRDFVWHYVATIAVILLSSFVVKQVQTAILDLGSQDVMPGGMTGRSLFYNVYLGSAAYDNLSTSFVEENGPYTTEMIALVRTGIRDFPDLVLDRQGRPEFDTLFLQYDSDPDQLAYAIFSNPTRDYYWYLWRLLDATAGYARAEELFLRVSLEYLQREPKLGVTIFSTNLRHYFLGPPIIYDYGTKAKLVVGNYPFTSGKETPSNLGLPASIQDETRDSWQKDTKVRWLRNVLLGIAAIFFGFLRPITAIFMLLVGALSWRLRLSREGRLVLLLCLGISLYSGVVVSSLLQPHGRFVFHTFQVEFIVAISGLIVLLDGISAYRRVRPRE